MDSQPTDPLKYIAAVRLSDTRPLMLEELTLNDSAATVTEISFVRNLKAFSAIDRTEIAGDVDVIQIW